MRGGIALCLKMDLKRLELDKGLQTNTSVLQKPSLGEKKKKGYKENAYGLMDWMLEDWF